MPGGEEPGPATREQAPLAAMRESPGGRSGPAQPKTNQQIKFKQAQTGSGVGVSPRAPRELRVCVFCPFCSRSCHPPVFCALGCELVSTALPGNLPSWEEAPDLFSHHVGCKLCRLGDADQLRTEPGASPVPSGYALPHLQGQSCGLAEEAGSRPSPKKKGKRATWFV